MTTRVTVEAHAWRSRVTIKSVSSDPAEERIEYVEPRDSRVFLVQGGDSVLVQEIQPADADAHPSAKAQEADPAPEAEVVKPLSLRGASKVSETAP